MNQNSEEKTLVTNKRAEHDYFILNRYEAGIALKGTEVKSLRQGKANFLDSYVDFINGEAYLVNMHISEYTQGNRFNHEEKRKRKLLLKKNEILKLQQKVKEKGYTVIPLRAYVKNGKIKIEIALARGKKMYDKRESIAEKDLKRELERKYKIN
ncbi:MAG: SsrA-binding protein SmpB [Ignavibacteria bacterium]|jgi:SsrA-binding protein|nr:SsrA-binding protein SmpB [Ignavibacteria bacterium]MDH7528459.1 SsrA-binding protein SmpB [Ignavibacteria bacterium]